jgi:hypothetical protein
MTRILVGNADGETEVWRLPWIETQLPSLHASDTDCVAHGRLVAPRVNMRPKARWKTFNSMLLHSLRAVQGEQRRQQGEEKWRKSMASSSGTN